jgi:hypothetical protein
MVIRNVAIYLLISRDKGENVDTLQSHRERLTRYCNEKGYDFIPYMKKSFQDGQNGS